MVIIQEIQHIRSMACIVLDSGEQYWIRHSDLADAGFFEMNQYSREDFLHQIRILQYPKALNHAVSMLAMRPCSKAEIRNRLLQKHYSEDVADLVVFKLEKENLLDDRDFCEQWIRSRMSRRYGHTRIRRELKMKGIDEHLINECLDNLDTDEEKENAVILASKLWNRTKPADDIRKSRQKIVASLVRKGYDWETAKKACDKAEQEIE